MLIYPLKLVRKMSNPAEPIQTVKIGVSTYLFYSGESSMGKDRINCTCYRQSKMMWSRHPRTVERNFSFATEHDRDLYIEFYLKKIQDIQDAKDKKRAERNANRKINTSKVRLTEERVAVYNGLKKTSERSIAVKGYWTQWNDGEVAFCADGYGYQVPEEVRKIEGVRVENRTDSMTDYFDTDTLYLKENDNKLLYDMLVKLVYNYGK